MALEIERKFLVVGDDYRSAPSKYYCQGYLSRDPARTVRVRVVGGSAWLTIKGLSVGSSRAEFEYEIPVDDARQLLQLCDGPLIEKNRYVINYENSIWEVDEFMGANQGLIVAEIELEYDSQAFPKPAWIGREVTEDARYFNANLVTHPFAEWPENNRT